MVSEFYYLLFQVKVLVVQG